MNYLRDLLFNVQKTFFKKLLKATLYVAFCVFSGVYFGNVLFGERSLEVLKNLQKEKKELFNDINRLKAENAKLQKEYFEKKALEPDN